MPCYATGSAEGDARMDAREAQIAAVAATRAACELVAMLRSRGMRKMLNQLTPATKAWIVEHDAKDAREKQRVAAEKERAKARAAALKKLNAVERKALGLA